MNTHREIERQVTMTITIPVYGMVEHVNKVVTRIKRLLELNMATEVSVEVVETATEDPDQLEFKYG